MHRFRTDGLALLIFAGAALVFYWPALIGGLVLLPLDNLWTMPPWIGPAGAVPHNRLIGDMILQNYPWKVILQQALHQRELPLWNPYELNGLPYLATAQTGVLYPFTWLFLILGPLRAYGWYTALHQLLAASLTYLLLRRLGVGWFGAVVAGFTFAFGFFLTVSYIWPMVLGAAVWLPLALWSLLGLARAIEKGALSHSIAVDLPIGAVAIALGILGGHTEIAFYATFVVAVAALYLAGGLLTQGRSGRAMGLLAVAGLAVGLGVLIGAVQLAPFIEVLQTNNRQGETTYHQVVSYALPKLETLRLIMPDFFGSPTTHAYFDLTTFRETPVGPNALGQLTDPPHTIDWGVKNYVEAGGYVGVVPLLLAAVGVIASRHRLRWLFAGLAVVSLLLALGTPLYALIYYGLPFFSQLRTPFRWLYPFDFSMAVLAGLGADWLWLSKSRRVAVAGGSLGEREVGGRVLRQRLIRTALPWLPAVAGIGGLLAVALSLAMRHRSVALADRILARRPELQKAFSSGAMLYSYELRNLAIFFALLAVGGGLIAFIISTRHQKGRAIAAALLLATIVGDLFFFGMPFATKAPATILDQHLDLTAVLPPNLAGPRITSLGDPEVPPANLAVLLGLPDVSGYDTIIPRRFVQLWSLIEPPDDLPYNRIGRLHQTSSLGSPILDLLGVRYVLTTSDVASPAARLIGRVGDVRVYERPSALPRAFVVGQARWVPNAEAAFTAMARADFDPAREVILEGQPGATAGGGSGTAEIVAYSFDRVVIEVRARGPAWLVLSDANAPGWQATVDGKEAPVLTADGDLRAVYLAAAPAATHQVIFRYRPLSLRLGGYLSFLGLTMLALVASWPLWRRLIGHYAGQAERVLRNTTLPMFTAFLNKGVDFGFAALLLRILGPGEVGAYTVAIALMGYFEILTNFGLNALIIREVSHDRDRAGRYLANAVAFRLGLCLLAAPLVGLVALLAHGWIGLADQGVVAFVLLAVALVPGNVSATLTALFHGWERIEIPATLSVAINLGRVTLGTAALLTGAGIVGLAAIALALNVAQVIVFTLLARRVLAVRLSGPVPADLPAMIAESLPLLVNHILVTVFFKIDVPLLQLLQGSEAVGYYATAYKWLDGFLIVPSTFTFAVYPALSRFAQQAGEGLRTAYEVSARILLASGIPLAVAVAFLSGDLILLLGGDAYYPQSARALAILICFLPFSYLNGLTQYVLIAVKRQRFITLAFVISAIFNVVANLLLIPRYSFYAASAITVASEIVLMIPFLIAVRQSVGALDWRQTAGKPALAGAVMILVVWSARSIEPHLAVLLGVVAYVGAVWLLRVFSPAEIAVLRGVVGALRRQSARPSPVQF